MCCQDSVAPAFPAARTTAKEVARGSERRPAYEIVSSSDAINFQDVKLFTFCILETKLKLATKVLNFARGERGVRLDFSKIHDCFQSSNDRLTK
jgi:hypothetical protein